MIKRTRRLVLLGVCAIVVSGAAAQPFDIPAPNVPDDVRGLNPSLTVTFGSHEWGDYNGDGEMDFVMLGRLPVTSVVTVPLFGEVFRSSPSRPEPTSPVIYNYFTSRSVTPMWLSDAEWADFDNDGDLDLITVGATTVDGDLGPSTILYLAEGNLITAADGVGLVGLYGGAAAFGDFDNDGDLDLALSGVRGDGRHVTTVYRNDGPGGFIDTAPGILPLAYGDVDWVDYDGDYDLDLLVSGAEEGGPERSVLYRNEGGVLVDSGLGLPGLSHSSADWADYDSDGDPDLVITGYTKNPLFGAGVTRVFRNEAGTLTEGPFDLPGVYYGSVRWIDYDSDGEMDVVLSGRREAFGGNVTLACVQQGDGQFTCGQIPLTGLGAQPVPGLAYGTVSWADYDHDSDLDLFVTGDLGRDDPATVFYRNAGLARNLAPASPSDLQNSVGGAEAELSWAAGVDPDGPAGSLTYNVRVGTSPGGVDVVSPHANPTSGTRFVLRAGNAGSNLGFLIRSLAPGTYYWSVQAIDNSFAGSSFAAERVFTIGG